MGRLILAMTVLAWVALGAWSGLWLCPQMIVSGKPNLIMLAYLAPCCWLLASVLFYIGWAELAWPAEQQHVEPPLDTSLNSHPRLAHA